MPTIKVTEGKAFSFDVREYVETAKKAELRDAPAHGTVEIKGRLVTYHGKPGVIGADSFQLRVRKGGGSTQSLAFQVAVVAASTPEPLAARARKLTSDLEAAPRVTATTTTLQLALKTLKPGEVLYLDRGAYAGTYQLPYPDTMVLIGPGAVLAAEFVLPSA